MKEYFPIGGELGTTYVMTLQANGISEAKYYTGGTRAAGTSDPPNPNDPMGVDTFYVGGQPTAPRRTYPFDETRARDLTYASRRTDTSLLAQAQVDFLVAMAKNDGDRVNYAAVALETRENRELVELYRKALSIPFPIAMADAATLAGTGPFHDVSAVPVTVLIDREGRVAWRADGRVAKSEELRLAMRGLLF